jgi:uncharacterized protein
VPSCEIIVNEFFPSVRALIAKELTDHLNHTQAEAARLMGITQPAICQYKKSIRGKNCQLLQSSAEVMNSIKESAKMLATMPANERPDIMCNVCAVIRSCGLIEQLNSSKANKSSNPA